MTLIKPVSSLSIKRAVNLYTIILFISFGALLYWLATERYQVFVDSHENTSSAATKMVAFQLNKMLKEYQRGTEIIIEDSKEQILELARRTEKQNISQKLVNRLKKHHPEFLKFCTLSMTGKPITGSISGYTDMSCMKDIERYTDTEKLPVRLNHNKEGYYFDIISHFSINNKSHIYIVSFSLAEIYDLLNSAQSRQHNLMIAAREGNNTVAISSDGDIKKITTGLNFKIQNGVDLSSLSKVAIKNTDWHAVDMSESTLFSDYRNKILVEFSIAYYILAMIVLFMRHILLNQDAKRTAAEEQLKKNHEQIKILNNSLDQLSKKDSLTGLYNRRYFDEMIKHEWNRALRSQQHIACILLDIDHFKNYNDHYGHQAGDKCIIKVADLLKNSFRRASDIIARYGGEEFIIFMADSSEEQAKISIIKFQLALKKLKIPHQASETDKEVTISAGIVAGIPTKNSTIDSFISNADTALYKAKENGRNQLVVYQEEQIKPWSNYL